MPDNNNGGSNGPINGDILNALSGDVTLIRGDTSAIRDNTDLLSTMNQNISAILQNVGKWSQQDVRSRIYDTSNNGRTGQAGPYNRNRNQNQNRDTQPEKPKSKYTGKPEDFLDAFFEEIEKNLFGSGFKSALQQNMKDFANAMGLQLEELPSAFGKTLANQLKQTRIGKGITDRVNGAVDNLIERSMNGMRSGINRYYDRATQRGDISGADATDERARWDEVITRMTENFRNRRTTINNDPTPGGSDDNSGGSNPPPPSGEPTPDPEVPKILEDKLQYLYPIYNSVNSINEGVRIIADSVTSSSDALSNYHDLFKQNKEDNDNFISDLLSQGQGSGGGSLIDSLLGDAGFQGALGDLTGALAGGSLSVEAGLAGLVGAALPVAGAFIAITAASWLLDKAMEAVQNCFKPLTESFEDLTKTMSKVTNRYFESERQKLQKRTDRLTQDVETLVRKPFEIMEAAANDWYNAWDNNLKTINATQGYTKSDLQSLMSSYAERLRSENLASVVSAADISSNLAKVLDSGMSGRVAEEFAYLATVLNNAIPTQDFFSYASTYASIAANQIALGKSQADAISAANAQLTQFASSLLYSSRELSGGFSTGLSSASNLLENAVKIATTARIGDSSYISATLTAVSSIVGAIAPDLAGSITDAIVDAALGGNTDSLVALRSLADTGASNTAFLNAFARDPKGVLTTLFTNLSNMQNMNTANFMEVAESLASTFGLSIGALTRVDFASLAEAVSHIDVTMNSLDQNMRLLQEGQTTTTAEQLKMNQVNEMILNEGLSYVLDNEAARAIQQHMWDQEIAAQLMETTYGVELEGKALEFLSGIFETINNILNLLNPFSWLGKIFSITDALNESQALKLDVKQVLEAGKVGNGNQSSLYNLTTYDVDKLINQPQSLVEMMGRRSAYSAARAMTKFDQILTGNLVTWGGMAQDALTRNLASMITSSTPATAGPMSQYTFATKGLYNTVSGISLANRGANAGTINSLSATSSQALVSQKSTANLQSFLDSMQEYVEADKSYKEWINTAQSYNISKLDQALEEYDLTMADLENKYQEYQAARASEYDFNKDQREVELWDRILKFLDEEAPMYFEEIRTRMDMQIDLLTSIDSTLTTFLGSWQNDWLIKAWNIDWLSTAWRSEWIQAAWKDQWISQSWGKDWLQDAWKTDWIQNAWYLGWIRTAWQKAWLEDAWQKSWLDSAWGEQWLQKAWANDWLKIAWYQDWIENSWNNGFITMWKTEWLQKAWKQSWLTKAWGTEWLKNAWNTDWLETAWYQDWLANAWNTDWLEKAWKEEWLAKAWGARWLQEEWGENWLENAWKQDWLAAAWYKSWLEDAWAKDWVEEAFNKNFVGDIITNLWGNRWWEFFNIFRDRFGGITTEAGDGLTSGKTTIDTEGLYQIYTKETGKAAENALKEVENKDETGDAILALTKQLTQNTVDLRDPQVQTNVLLSQILIVLEAIMQAENTAGGASLATTLASLGMGLTTPNTANTAGI